MRRTIAVSSLIVLLAAALAWAQAEAPVLATTADEAFASGAIVVKGEGAAPADRSLTAGQRKILALRAAKVIALREASEIVDGVVISGETTVVNASVELDEVRTTVDGLIKGAQVVREDYDPLSEMGTVYVSVPMTGPNGLIPSLLPRVIPLLPESGPAYQPGAAAAASYDGLIIDVRAHDFRPALVNRVVTGKGDTVYDPSRLSKEVLVDWGGAGYTDDIAKARAILNGRGSTSPAVVKASALAGPTDVVVGPGDASAIFAANQSTGFLDGARVVFVTK